MARNSMPHLGGPLSPDTAVALPLLLALLICAAAREATAWVYPEHRDITIAAVEKLDPAHRAVFDRLWREARVTRATFNTTGGPS